jgi:hypothetical protein
MPPKVALLGIEGGPCRNVSTLSATVDFADYPASVSIANPFR